MDLSNEVLRTNPERVVFNPGTLDKSTGQTGNEHLLVERLAGGELLALWTQSSYEGCSNHHIVLSRSSDEGLNWSPPRTIAGPDHERGLGMASWALPVVSKSGRIYVFFSRHPGLEDFAQWPQNEGMFCGMYSSDDGESWSEPECIPVPWSQYDEQGEGRFGQCVIWQKPERLSRGKHYAGQTRWTSRASRENGIASVTEFLRFENIDDDPEIEEVQISWICGNDKALRFGKNLEEPSIVTLPDGRLFCTLRSSAGHPCYSISADEGDSWDEPLPLRLYDDGPVMKHPLSPCPIYPLGANEWAFFYHGHDRMPFDFVEKQRDSYRRPGCVSRGEWRPDAKQPIWFSEPWVWMDTGGIPLVWRGLSMYSSVTPIDDGFMLWYPDRKFFLLGRPVTRAMLAALKIGPV